MSYKENEVEFYNDLENNLMETLCITTRAELHKAAIRKLDSIVNPLPYSIV